MSEHTPPHLPPKEGEERPFHDILKFILYAAPLVFLFRMFIAQPFIVRGESMFPTFENKEYLIVEEISYHLSDPMRGDVVVFKYPLDPKQFFIKRIIGLPGETVSVSGGVVTIFNTENPGGLEFQETFLDEWEDTRSPLTLENDEYFVMGDNRENSSDSRRWGPVNEKLIVGRAFIRLWPLDNLVIRPGEQEEEYN